LQRLGRIAIVPAAVQTSARRWERLGVVKTTLLNQVIVAGFYLGVPPDRLRQLYRGGKNPRSESRGRQSESDKLN
jgi:hypothetical protein